MTFLEYKRVRSELRQVVKHRNLTYDGLGKKMNLSEVTIKRFFSEDKYSSRIFDICQALELSFFDLVEMAKIEKKKHFELNSEQEEFFLKNLGYFAIFREIYRNSPLSDIQKRWSLTSPQLTKILLRLEKIGLIEVISQDKVKVIPKGVLELKKDSKLELLLRHRLTEPFLDEFRSQTPLESVYQNSEIEVSEETRTMMVTELEELIQRFCTMGERDKALLPKKDLKSIRWLFCFSEFKTHWENFKP